jgi:hypothetical protein
MLARTMGRAGLAIAACAALVLAPERASGQVATEPIRIDFHAHDGCPDEGKFTGEVRARTAKARIAFPAEPARFFRVNVTRDRGTTKSRGKLTIEDPGGAVSVREVSGESCGEVVSALALITALAIDPKASTAVEPPPHPPPVTLDSEPPLHVPATPPQPAPVWPHKTFDPPEPWPWPPIAPPLPVWLTPPQAREPVWRDTVGVELGVMGGVAPGLSLAFTGFLERSWSEGIALVGPIELQPAVRAAVTTMNRKEAYQSSVGTAGFHLLAAHADACPVAVVPLPIPARLQPCLGFTGGSLQASGQTSGLSATRIRGWASIDGILRINWIPLDYLVLNMEAALALPLIRDEFQFDSPLEEIHTAPFLSGSAGAGVGVRFP